MPPPQKTFTAFVLAGGRSRRMGRDKASLPWGPHTLLDHMIEKLTALTPDVRVVGRPPLADLVPDRGPVEGLRTALTATQTEANLIVAVDLPFLPETLLRRLIERLDTAPLVACSVEGRIPLCLSALRSILPDIDTYFGTGRRSVEGFLESTPGVILPERELALLGAGAQAFRNLNSPDDYRQARP